ncbi:actin-like ATPase domain-containing protein [Hesseltinella vesiculosa]|uniref:Actin-like ATPase domain-containing protein n=1 Tax=Hesseltinella vesiculosa TaxID=101127 RepID=A0A1X2G6Y9_9FUNG|nr:actin-like ATPase domain-containing protein [Hesseltinella vesiculosa]
MGYTFDDRKYPVIVGIDFGTTFSGCSYTLDKSDEIYDVVSWPDQKRSVYPKTPSLALYEKGSTEMVAWGHQARRLANRPNSYHFILMSKFKLFLDAHMQDAELPNDLQVVDIIADYLRGLMDHAKIDIHRRLAGMYSEEHFRYCLTVPAMWNDRAKSMMREASIRAGMISYEDPMERLLLTSEPEAAALYCQRKSSQFNLKHGQRFMVCDAGGGTVDLMVLEINHPPGSPQTLREVTRGHGATCGSGLLDNRMRHYLMDKLAYVEVPEESLDQILDTFVNAIKPEFDGVEDHYLDLPANMGLGDITDSRMGLDQGTLWLPARELKDYVFDPVINQVLDLIEGQLEQSPRLEALFLVGGFGQSNYLFQQIESAYASRIDMIGVPPRGELAVVRGAVYFGRTPQVVTERVSRRTYGVETRMLFDDRLDPVEYMVVGLDDQRFSRHRFSVYVTKGQPIKIDECVSKKFVIRYPNGTDSDLFAYDGDGPPPRHVKDYDIKKVGKFPIKMPKIPGAQPGDRVKIEINMYFGLTEIHIECVIADNVFNFTSAFDASM